MVRCVGWSCVAGFIVLGVGATPALSADDFSDFPDVPQMDRFDETFREAGFYVGARGGAAWLNDSEFTITGPALVENDYEAAFGGSLFVGLDIPDLYWGLGLRAEAELSYWQADIDRHTVGGTAIASSDSFGSTDAWLGMANLYLDYGVGAFRPFVGAGIGVARVDFDDHGVTGSLGVMDDRANGFAWQVMGGLAYDVTSRVTLEAMVRYQAIEDVELVSATGPTSSVDLSSTQILVGSRVRF